MFHGDCLTILPTFDTNSIDAIVTDPPYGLSFMSQTWDKDIAFNVAVWRECLRVLKPGGHMLVFGSTRTHHRLWCAVEDAGFEIRDQISWVFSNGFPKSQDVSKAIDKKLGGVRQVVGVNHGVGKHSDRCLSGGVLHATYSATAPATPQAAQWEGWGTALGPAYEPILLARKPLDGTIADNVLKHGVGGINIDASRVEVRTERDRAHRQSAWSNHESSKSFHGQKYRDLSNVQAPAGRWPKNLIHDGSNQVLELFPRSNGDEGSCARFFAEFKPLHYCSKASKSERDMGLDDMAKKPGGTNKGGYREELNRNRPVANFHPTVKPISLMRYLCRLICPPSGTILDPFTGSGSTGVAAVQEGFKFIGIEMSTEYVEIAERRIQAATLPEYLAEVNKG